jgi:hypothetical protein
MNLGVASASSKARPVTKRVLWSGEWRAKCYDFSQAARRERVHYRKGRGRRTPPCHQQSQLKKRHRGKPFRLKRCANDRCDEAPEPGAGQTGGAHWQSIAYGLSACEPVITTRCQKWCRRRAQAHLGRVGRGPETERSTGAMGAGVLYAYGQGRKNAAEASLGTGTSRPQHPRPNKSGGGAAPSDDLFFLFFFGSFGAVGVAASLMNGARASPLISRLRESWDFRCSRSNF